MAKYELLAEKSITVSGVKLFRIRATVSFGSIQEGEEGGFVESEDNLSQSDEAWVYGEARVFGKAQVCGEARVYGEARVSGKAQVFDEAQVSGEAQVFDEAQVSGEARVFDEAQVSGKARVSGEARVFDEAQVSGEAQVFGEAQVSGEAQVFGEARVSLNPVVVLGLDYQVTVSDNALAAGCQCHTFAAWRSKTPQDIAGMDGAKATAFYPTLLAILVALGK